MAAKELKQGRKEKDEDTFPLKALFQDLTTILWAKEILREMNENSHVSQTRS